MKLATTICVYGDFAKKDIRIKPFAPGGGCSEFTFQNVLRDAGYDAELFCLNDTDLPWLVEKKCDSE